MNDAVRVPPDGSASRSSGWRTRRWSPAAAALPATSISRASFTCGWCAPTTRTAGSSSIDTEAALALPGVVAVWTAADIADMPPIDFREGPIERLAPYRQPVLAQRPACAMSASRWRRCLPRTPIVAEDAADLVDGGDRGTAAAARRREAEPGEFVARPRHRSRRSCTQGYGDVDAVFRRRRTSSSWSWPSAAIPACRWRRAARIGRYDAARDVLELHGAAKVPHRNSELLARMLGRAAVVGAVSTKSHVGGGFGIRGELYPEDVLVCVAAMRLERPVKWIEDRREHLIAANHSRHQHHHIRAAVDRRRRDPRHRRRDLSTTGRLCAHPRHARRR